MNIQERDYLDKIRFANEDSWTKISLIESEKADLDKNLQTMKHQLAESDKNKDMLVKEYTTEMNRLKHENIEYRTRTEALENDLRTLSTDKEHQSIALEKLRTRADEALQNLCESNAKIESQSHTINLLQ
jgi:chromosome segregation ATPase